METLTYEKIRNEIDIKDLENLAIKVLDLKQKNPLRQRRPLIVEFCGSPKSGKTSTINSLNIFLKRNEFRTVILTERANICPVSNKLHPFFNIWTTTSGIAEMIKLLTLYNENQNFDIILTDRFLFDSLCWFEWLKKNNSIDEKIYNSIENFITLPLFTRKIDVTYIFEVSPEISMKREYANLLTRKEGSIMNARVLSEYKDSIKVAEIKFAKKFQKIQKIDTGNLDQNTVSKIVTYNTLMNLEDILIEHIGFFERDNDLQKIVGIENYGKHINLFGEFDINQIYFDKLSAYKELKFGPRDKIELTENIQPIPIVVFTDYKMKKVLLIKKRLQSVSKDSPERDKHLIYVGGHIRKEDSINDWNFFNIVKNTLEREIEEELGIALKLENYLTEPYLIYNQDNSTSQKHLAICYIVKIDLEERKFHPNSNEILKKSYQSKSGTIVNIKELEQYLRQNAISFEFWSIKILERVFGFQGLPVQQEIDFMEFN